MLTDLAQHWPRFELPGVTTPLEPRRLRWQRNEHDPVIDEVRRIRREISEQFGHDPARLAARYIEMQQQSKDRLIDINDHNTKPHGADQSAA